ncbi:MAG: hypothetical protein A2V46_13895 [Bacteroidetes bacterium RBG_19FT_COMBO_42_7]|nr:MAG: hypothetical protein A2Y71_01600 [Bacteroidetes bacterium RBG_13_42_15]OFY80280.1 MAG: hypothetical protein A2V46_13895 [Bacteroidetes bacterium RBG_19FT_COMBO_42_7]
MTHSTSYRRILHRMEYYNYQRGLIFHHLEEEGSWNSHLKNCRNFILKSVDFYKPSKITVLGSGWLLDLPLKELNDTVAEINLVDIIHPPEVKEQAAGLKRVVLVEEDITGGLIEEVWKKSHNKTFLNRLNSLEVIEIPEYQPEFDPGMVISLNILTQLESLPLEFLKKRSRKSEESYLQFRKEVQSKHIAFLKKHKSVLITDISEIITENSGNIRENPSVVTDLPEAKFKDEWTWNFDHRKSDYYRKRSVFNVLALAI